MLLCLLLSILAISVAASPSIAAPKICRVTDFVMRRRAPPNTPPFLHSPKHSASCNSLILDRHERPTEKEMLAIFKVLPNTQIESLHMMGVTLSVDVIVHLAAFVANSKIRLLHLVDLDNLGEAGLMILAEAIRKTITLETVILANMYHSIGQDAGNMLKTTLREHPKLNHLDLRGFLGGPYLIDAIVGGLRNGNIKSLCLRQIGLNATGLRALASTMPISSVEHLDLSGNRLGDAGARIVAHRILNRNSSLRELDLSNNDMTDLAAADLAVSLESDRELRHLILSDNIGITDEGIAEFNEVLIDPGFYGNQILVSLELTPPHGSKREVFIKHLQHLNSFLSRNQKLQKENEIHVLKRKHWPHEGSISGSKSLIGVEGTAEFTNWREDWREDHNKKRPRKLDL